MKFKEYIDESLPDGFEGFGFDEIKPTKSQTNDTIKLGAKRDSIIKVKNMKFKVFRVNGDFSFSVIKVGTKGKKYYELVNSGNGDMFEVWELTGGGMDHKGNKPVVQGKAKVI